jgi:hypothetical protein
MRLACVAFGVALAGFVIFPVTDAGAAVAGLIAVGLLVLLGYRDGTWRGLRWALIMPVAALVADVITFTPLSLQPETDVAIYTFIALYYLPAWALLVAVGIGARRLQRRRRSSSSTPTAMI